MMPAAPVAILENRKVLEALSVSEELSKGFWGRLFILFVVFVLLASTAGAVLFFLVGTARQVFGPGLRVVGSFAVGFTLFFVVVQWWAIAVTLHYYDVRQRKQGGIVAEAGA